MSDNKNEFSVGDVVGFGAGIGIACAVFALVFTLTVYPLWKCVSADAKADFCYVSTDVYSNPSSANVVVYHLWQHVPWRADRIVGRNYDSLVAAHEDAGKIGCEIH